MRIVSGQRQLPNGGYVMNRKWKPIHEAANSLNEKPTVVFALAWKHKAARHVAAGRFGEWQVDVERLERLLAERSVAS